MSSLPMVSGRPYHRPAPSLTSWKVGYGPAFAILTPAVRILFGNGDAANVTRGALLSSLTAHGRPVQIQDGVGWRSELLLYGLHGVS